LEVIDLVEIRDRSGGPAPPAARKILLEEEKIMAMPNVGDKAPEFSLPVSRDQKVGPGDFKGKKNVVLAFYPLDFTGG
jgi:peroxiredoxin